MPLHRTRPRSGRSRTRPARHAAAWSLAVALVLAAGCGGDDEPATAPTATESTSSLTEPLDLSAELVRSRRDEANERLRVELTNRGDQAVPIDGVQLVAEPYTPQPGEISGGRELGPGRTFAYQVVHGDADCVGDDPRPGPVEVRVTSGEQQITLDPGESSDLIDRMLTADCARQRILDVVSIRFGTEWDVHGNGNEQVGTLLIERHDGGPPVTLTGVRNSINYTLEMLDPDSRPTLDEGEKILEVPVRSRGARCDGHAMGDNSKPFGFSAFLSLGVGPETLVEFTADDQPENFLRLCS
ncbi:MAG TPA: hypothetical protein VFZ85_19400 [Jiangellaceae bacterium]